MVVLITQHMEQIKMFLNLNNHLFSFLSPLPLFHLPLSLLWLTYLCPVPIEGELRIGSETFQPNQFECEKLWSCHIIPHWRLKHMKNRRQTSPCVCVHVCVCVYVC